MNFYSQLDPRWRHLRLGNSKLTVGGYGCFFCAMCTLYQVDPLVMLQRKDLFDLNGNLYSAKFAQVCGGNALPTTYTAPDTWCIGLTKHYAPDFPTHFVVTNVKLNQQIDPLDPTPVPESRSYSFAEYRVFTNTKLKIDRPWQEEAQEWATKNAIIGSGWDAPDAPMSQVRVAQALKNFAERFIK